MGWFSLLKSTKSLKLRSGWSEARLHLSFSRSEMQEASWVFSLSCPISTGVGSNSTAGWKETWPELSVTSWQTWLQYPLERLQGHGGFKELSWLLLAIR